MNKLYTDDISKLKKLNLKYELLEIKDYQDDLNSVFLISNKNFNIKDISDKGFVISLFKSEYSDFEILNSDELLIKERLNYFYDAVIDKFVGVVSEHPLEEINEESIAEIQKEEIIIDKVNTFKGIYIKGILLNKGNIRFTPIYEVILYIFKARFNGKLSLFKRGVEFYTLYFIDGELTNINSFNEDDNFQYFLKKYGYIANINKEIYLYPINKQLDIFIGNNSVFKYEKNIIYKDYITFLFRNIVVLKSGDFELIDINDLEKSKIFTDYFNFLYNFINYIKNVQVLSNNLMISDEYNFFENHFNDEILGFINELKNGKKVNDLYLIFSKYDEKYIKNAMYFLIILGILEDNKEINSINISSTNINENVSQRIKIWLEKIKQENYFTLLGININDNNDFIEEKFRNLFSQFSNYLSAEELRMKYKNDLENILFELESAYNVLKDKELKEKYYNAMLK
jgi:hypothetical protein